MSELEDKMFNTYGTETDKYRAMIEEYSTILHPQHFQLKQNHQENNSNSKILPDQMLLLKHCLAYSLRGQLTLSEVEEKVKLQEEYMNVFKIVDPGFTK